MTNVSGRLIKNLQLGVGKSVIVDLPEDASEIYVGDPRIANAIVRSARRIYVSGLANGQTSIFALEEMVEGSQSSTSPSGATSENCRNSSIRQFTATTFTFARSPIRSS
jgi:Flp pilus assembly secretin CpaC